MKKKLEVKTNSEKKKRSKPSKSDNEISESLKAEVLDVQGLREGMVVLGCVIEVRPSLLLMSLPGCLVGNVPLSNVSSKYTELLMHSTGEKEEEAADLSSLVEVGSTYPCKVLKVSFKEKLRNPNIILSIDPRVVNSELRLQSLYLKMALHASVQSVEDHGYIVDVGVPGVQGFLPFSACSGDKSLVLGQIVPTSVRKLPSDKQGNVVWLSRIASNEPFPEIEDKSMKLTSILPGANVTALIIEIKQPFIYMKCMNFDACANMMSLGASNHNLSEATKVTGTVLYVHPVSHMIYLHLGVIPTPATFNKFFRCKKFDMVKNARHEYFWHHRLLFKMNKGQGAMGFVKKMTLPEKGPLSRDSLSKNPVIPKSRVVFLHYMDNLVQLSLSETTINLEIIKPEDVQVGDIYEATVTNHVGRGMFVAICPGFSGFVKHIHMSDSFVTMPEKLCPVGTKVNCRVMSVEDPLSFNMSCKESLLRIPASDLLLTLEHVQKGDTYKGVVVHKTETHLLVLFFNNIKGIVYCKDIPESSVLFVGQTVSCRVLQCNPEKGTLQLSLMGDISSYKTSKNTAKKPSKSATKDALETVFDPKKKHKAIIKSITGHQLNVVLDGGHRGRVHVTEIGNATDGTMPLKDFKVSQCIKVHVLSLTECKIANYLAISHRRKRQYLECALSFPPTAPLHQEPKQWTDVTGYVKEASDKSCILWLSPVQTATLDYLHFSENAKELRKIKKHLKPGLAVSAKVLEVKRKSKEGNSFYNIILTKLVDDQAISVGHNIAGLVQVACPEKSLVLKLPHGYHGTVPLCDLQDTPTSVNRTLERCRRLLFVKCHIVEVNHSARFCVLSLRKSRLYGTRPDEDSHPEITPSNLTQGTRVMGFVKTSHRDHLIVNFGRMLDGRVGLHLCDTRGCAFCIHTKEVLGKCTPGEVVEVVVDGIDAKKNLYPLSLPEFVGVGLSQESRLSVAEDINWEDM